MLEGRHHTGALELADVGGADDSDEVRILADALLGTAPPVVADHVEDGCEALVDADRPHARSDRGGHLTDQVRIEGRPHASGHGKTVADQVMKPVRHSSCAIAGMPKRFARAILDCSSTSRLTPCSGGTGAVPNTRVSWPRPVLMIRSSAGAGSPVSSSMGATDSPGSEAVAQNAESWPAFSSTVMRLTSAATRSAIGSRVSRQASALVSSSPIVSSSPCGTALIGRPPSSSRRSSGTSVSVNLAVGST
jgi:hypothetical protein